VGCNNNEPINAPFDTFHACIVVMRIASLFQKTIRNLAARQTRAAIVLCFNMQPHSLPDITHRDKQPSHHREKRRCCPKALRRKVWETYATAEILDDANTTSQKVLPCQTKCACCSSLVTVWDFEVGHVQSAALGGDYSIQNLRILCRCCNSSMGTQNLFDFKRLYFSTTPPPPPSPAAPVDTDKIVRMDIDEENKTAATLTIDSCGGRAYQSPKHLFNSFRCQYQPPPCAISARLAICKGIFYGNAKKEN
jgi:5-methylcytosine-specific restriction endonuclease McrA